MNLIRTLQILPCAFATLVGSTSVYAQLIHSSVSASASNYFSEWYNRPPDSVTETRTRDSAGSVDVNVQSSFSGFNGIAKASASPGTLHLESISYLSTFWHYHDGIVQWVSGSASTDSAVTYGDQLTFYTPQRAMGAPLSIGINVGVTNYLPSYFDTHGVDTAGQGSVNAFLFLGDADAAFVPTADSPSLPHTLTLIAQVANGATVPLFMSLSEHSEVKSFSDVNHIGEPPGIVFSGLSLNQFTTLTWAGVDFFSAGGARLRGTVESESGFEYGRSYYFPAVPEPALFTSAGASLLVLILIGRIRRNSRSRGRMIGQTISVASS